ncbi:MAG: DUF1326 domain-containing protein [Alphaproteobacteria bacterium]|nr:DUF1326 domain-containing protein [Alphaproteobacteria bacterium]
MAGAQWRLKGRWLKNCNCNYGCPCDFNAPPSQGECTGMAGMEIEEGHYGDVDLSGLRFAVTYHFPGPLHEGNGTMQAFVDERASEAQRNGLLTIMSGRESAEGTMFHIYSLIVEKHLTPQFVPIEFSFDKDGRRAQMVVPGALETTSAPIRNPVTGADHRIQVHMPEGFEHHEAEIASARTVGSGGIAFDIADGHSTLAHVEHTPDGVA